MAWSRSRRRKPPRYFQPTSNARREAGIVLWSVHFPKYSYIATLLLTTYRVCGTGFTSWLRGAFSRNDPERRSQEWRPAGAARTAPQGGPDPDRQAFMLGAGSRCRLRFHCREPASRVRIRKPPRWSAERGPGRPGTGGSRVAGATERMSAPVGAPSPLIGGTELLLSRRPLAPKPRGLAGGRKSEGTCERDAQTRAQQRAPRERTTLRCLTS